jgi:small subunit ribosomal protein S16
MLTIRLHRIGKTNQPSFKIVVVDKRVSAAAGKFREDVGSINRVTKQTKLDKDRIVYWISKGAQPSPTVNNILVAQKIIEGKKIAVHAQPKKKEGAAPAAAK